MYRADLATDASGQANLPRVLAQSKEKAGEMPDHLGGR